MSDPHSIEAEQAVLGALCVEPGAIEDVESVLPDPGAFYRYSHAAIYRAMLQLYRRDGGFDWASVLEQVAANGELDNAGGREALHAYLRDMSESVPSGYAAGRYAEVVMMNHVKRVAIVEAGEIVARARDGTAGTDDVLGKLWNAYSNVAKARGVSDRSLDVSEAITRAVEASLTGKFKGLYPGFWNLNIVLGGLMWGGLYYVGARPGKGKTALLLNLCEKLVLADDHAVPCGVWTSEMPAAQIGGRMLCSLSGVDSNAFRAGKLNHEQQAEVEHARERYREARSIRIDDKPGRNVYDLCNIFRGWIKRYGTRVFFVDYVQNVARPPGVRDDYSAIAETSKTLKSFALANNVIIVAAAQLNRKVEEAKRRPVMSDLEGAGALEQDADGIMMLHRPPGGSYTDPTYNYELNVVKNRHGATGRALFLYRKAVTRFEPVDRHAETQ